MIKSINQLLPRKIFAVVVSGGEDSIAAAHYLKTFTKKEIIIFHVNNHFIPQDDKTEKSVISFGVKYCIPVFVHHTTDKYTKGSKEAWARKERHIGFESLSKKTGIDSIILAHTLTDAKTSYLFDAIRGFTNRMPIPLSTQFNNYKVIRPFLLILKEVLVKYAQKNKLTGFIIDDELNCNFELTRNFLEQSVIPLIESKRHLQITNVVAKKIRAKIKDLI